MAKLSLMLLLAAALLVAVSGAALKLSSIGNRVASGAASAPLPSIGYTQSAAVNGTLTCNGEPVKNAKVKLYDEDDTDLDDLMAKGVTNDEGYFELSGKEIEVTPIEPKVNIYHHCNDEESINPLKKLCYKKLSIDIPASYITYGPKATKVFPLGTLNLANSFSGESRDCLNL